MARSSTCWLARRVMPVGSGRGPLERFRVLPRLLAVPVPTIPRVLTILPVTPRVPTVPPILPKLPTASARILTLDPKKLVQERTLAREGARRSPPDLPLHRAQLGRNGSLAL